MVFIGFHRTSWFSHTITSVCMVIVEWLLVGGISLGWNAGSLSNYLGCQCTDSYWQDYMKKRSMGNKSVARDIPSILSGGALLEDGYKELHSQDGNEMEIEGGIVGSPKSVAEELGEELLWQHLAQELQRQHSTEGEMSRQVREEEEAVAREIAEEEEHVASTAASELGQVGMQFLLVCQNIIYSCSAELGCLRMAE